VALEVQQVAAGDVADLVELDRAEGRPARFEGIEVVELGGEVDGETLLPLPAVGVDRIGQKLPPSITIF
jgi:hypothetical protein